MAEKRKSKGNVSTKKLVLLFTIVNRRKAEFYVDLIQSFEVNMQFVFMGEGTVDAKMKELLGLTDQDKAVICSVIREDRAKKAMEALEDKFTSIRDGKGVAVTVPFSSVIGVSVFNFLADNRQTLV